MKKNKAFTLIELIAVLVILAILTLIVTPLVMNIIKKARISADRRSIDEYGRSIELAISSYLLDEGKFPSSINDLTIKYSGDRVECSTTQLNSDSSIYLTGCKVAGRSVDYAYGTEKTITYKSYNVDYYVIVESGTSEANVTLLKATPLTTAEINQYGAGHINRYTSSSVGTAYNHNGYGGMAYYTSETCRFVNDSYVTTGCTTDYAQSEVKYVVDAWKNAKAPAASEARLITYDELLNNLGFELDDEQTGYKASAENTPSWVYNSNYWYWTMSQYEDSASSVWDV